MISNDSKKQKSEKKFSAEFNFINMIEEGLHAFLKELLRKSVTFQTFLEYTSEYFDQYILDTSSQEHIKYVGGKLFLKLCHAQTVQFIAEFYFQDKDRKWIRKVKEERINGKRFTDWETNPDLTRLRKEGNVEFQIEPPEK